MAYRTVHIDGRPYDYVVGSGTVNIKLPDGGSLKTTPWDIKGETPSVVERGKWKRTRDGMVTPSEIVDWIRVNHLGLGPVDRSSPPDPGPVPDHGEGAYWIRFRGVGRRVAALWSEGEGWRLAGSLSPVPGSGIEGVIGPVMPVEPELHVVTAWRNEADGGTRRVVVGVFTEPGPAKEAQVAILERVAAELEPIIGRRPRPMEAASAAHGEGLDDVWHVEVASVRANTVLVDVMAASAYSNLAGAPAMLGRRRDRARARG